MYYKVAFVIRGYSILLLIFYISSVISAQEIPLLINFSNKEYQAHNQNWSISQEQNGCILSANSGGMLIYDGVRWQKYNTPGNQIIRAINQDKKGRIFIGGYATIGYWDTNEFGTLHYQSLLDSIQRESIHNDEIWHFLETDRGLFFQSFSMLYLYHNGSIKAIRPPGNIMYIRQIGNRILVPVIQKGLYELLADGTFEFIPGSEFLIDKRVATILPAEGDDFLVGTQNAGIFKFHNGQFQHWDVPVNAPMITYQLNKGIRLSNGYYAFGTIVQGLFITNSNGHILYHVNQKNGLQNNTILALHESSDNNLWLGLDKGMAMIQTSSPLSFYLDKQGAIGTVYTAVQYDGMLYVGSNQGVFYKQWPDIQDQAFKLVKGTQGQVWNLKIFDDQLLCAHNSGTLKIKGGESEKLFSNTGVYNIIPIPNTSDHLLQGTYTGLALLKKNSRGLWQQDSIVKGFYSPAKETAFDAEGKLWIAHPRQGIYYVQLSKKLKQAIPIEVKMPRGMPKSTGVKGKLKLLNEQLYIRTDSLTLKYDQENQALAPVGLDQYAPLALNDFWITASDNSIFRIRPHRIEYLDSKGHWQSLQVNLSPGDENIIALNDSIYLLCATEGYALFNKYQQANNFTTAKWKPLITEVVVANQSYQPFLAHQSLTPLYLHANEKSIRLSYAFPYFPEKVDLQYRLVGYQREWSAPAKNFTKEYTNLPPGSYEFQLRSLHLSSQVASYPFIVAPHWYQTWWAACLGFIFLFLVGRWLWKLHHKRLAQQRREMEIEKNRELHRQKVEAKNELLRSEIENKNRKLADSTMNLVRKNEMLIKLKKDLKALRKKEAQESAYMIAGSLIRQIDGHISSEEDWEIFEANFNQLHDQFFKRLKESFPSLTPGDLRLAAFLKMNLSSKEVAPLLNISLRGVENKRYRLRRKMELAPEINLTEYLMQF